MPNPSAMDARNRESQRVTGRRRPPRKFRAFVVETMERRLLLAGTPTAPNIPGNWGLTFNDNFTSINSNVWANNYWWGTNSGTQTTFNPSALSINSNGLNITATQTPLKSNAGITNPYTSGLLSSGGVKGGQAPGFSFTYGYVETTSKVAPGQGMWSALWMLPQDYNNTDELDVMEILGRQPNYYTAAYHFGSSYFEPPDGTVPVDLTTGFHTYGVDWEPDHITWYFDGTPLGTFTNSSVIINRPMYLILNLDVGGPWAGPLTNASPQSSTWQVQDVRVWQHISSTTAPTTPTGLVSLAATNTSETLAWNPSTGSTGVAGYSIYRNSSLVGTVPGNVTTFTDTGLTSSTSYSYTVRAFDAAENTSSASSPLLVTTGGIDPPALTQVNLAGVFNSVGVVNDGTVFPANGGIDHSGTAYSANLLGTGLTWNGNAYIFGNAGTNNIIASTGQTIAVPAGNYGALNFLGTAVLGNQPSQTFIAHYADGTSQTLTQSMSDWFTPQNYGGEFNLVATSHRDLSSGLQDPKTFYVYGYSLNLNSSKTLQNITLPNNATVQIVAMDLMGPETQPPTVPSGLVSSATTTSSVAVSWLPSADGVAVTGYNVFRNGVKIGSVPGNYTYLVDSGLTPGTTYSYTVNAFNGAGLASGMSVPFVVTTLSTHATSASITSSSAFKTSFLRSKPKPGQLAILRALQRRQNALLHPKPQRPVHVLELRN